MKRLQSIGRLTPLDPWTWQEAKTHMGNRITIARGIDGALTELRQSDCAFKAFIRNGNGGATYELVHVPAIDMFGLALDELQVHGRICERNGGVLEVFTSDDRLASYLRAMFDAPAPSIAQRDAEWLGVSV